MLYIVTPLTDRLNRMSRTYGLKTASDLLAKLERDAQLLREEVSSDRFFNFVVTAYSLVDWIQNDPNIPAAAKADLPRFRATTSIQICRDLANASKHFQLDIKPGRKPIVTNAESEQGFGLGRFGRGGYGVGEEEVGVWLSASDRINGLDVKEQSLKEWRHFFSTHGL